MLHDGNFCVVRGESELLGKPSDLLRRGGLGDGLVAERVEGDDLALLFELDQGEPLVAVGGDLVDFLLLAEPGLQVIRKFKPLQVQLHADDSLTGLVE